MKSLLQASLFVKDIRKLTPGCNMTMTLSGTSPLLNPHRTATGGTVRTADSAAYHRPRLRGGGGGSSDNPSRPSRGGSDGAVSVLARTNRCRSKSRGRGRSSERESADGDRSIRPPRRNRDTVVVVITYIPPITGGTRTI